MVGRLSDPFFCADAADKRASVHPNAHRPSNRVAAGAGAKISSISRAACAQTAAWSSKAVANAARIFFAAVTFQDFRGIRPAQPVAGGGATGPEHVRLPRKSNVGGYAFRRNFF